MSAASNGHLALLTSPVDPYDTFDSVSRGWMDLWNHHPNVGRLVARQHHHPDPRQERWTA
jgi:hypothetical protein